MRVCLTIKGAAPVLNVIEGSRLARAVSEVARFRIEPVSHLEWVDAYQIRIRWVWVM